MENEPVSPIENEPSAAVRPAYALFSSATQAREALDALEQAGAPLGAISVAEAQPGTGVIFGLASTFTPGTGPFAWPGPYGNLYGNAVAGAFTPALVESPDVASLALTLADQGLPRGESESCASAILDGAVFVAINPAEAVIDAAQVDRILTESGGERLPAAG